MSMFAYVWAIARSLVAPRVVVPYVRPQPSAEELERRETAEREACDLERDFERETCDLCSGRQMWYCPDCYEPIRVHSHEGDYICENHVDEDDGEGGCGRFVDPISEHALRQLKARIEALS